MRLLNSILALTTTASLVLAQRSSSAPPPSSTSTMISTPATAASPNLSLFTSIYATTLTPAQARPTGAPASIDTYTTFQLAFTTVSSAAAPSSIAVVAAPAAVASAGKQQRSASLPLDTHIDPAFGVLGVLLILSGATLATLGPRVSWIHCTIIGSYALSLITFSVIFKVGVEQAVSDPSNLARGLFLLGCLIASLFGAIVCYFWSFGTPFIVSALGGLGLGLWIQTLHEGGLIKPIGYRWCLYAGCIVIFLGLSSWSRAKLYVQVISSAIVGSTALLLGVDCFTTVGLKEYYTRNLLGDRNFADRHAPTFQDGHFPLPPLLQVEIGVLAAGFVVSILLQTSMFAELRANFRALRSDDEDREMRRRAKEAERSIAKTAQRDLIEWERQHGYRTKDDDKASSSRLGKMLGRNKSSRTKSESLLPKHNDDEPRGRLDSELTMVEEPLAKQRSRTLPDLLGMPKNEKHHSNLASTLGDFSASTPAPTEKPAPAVQSTFTTGDSFAEQNRLLDEMAAIRRNIEALRSDHGHGGYNSELGHGGDATSPSRRFTAYTTQAPESSLGHGRDLSVTAAAWSKSDRPFTAGLDRFVVVPEKASPPLGGQQDVFQSRSIEPAFKVPAVPAHVQGRSLTTPTAPPTAAVAAPALRARASTNDARPQSSKRTQSAGGLPSAAPTRRVIDTPEAAQARYAKALNRQSAASMQGLVQNSAAGLTLGELEQRHRAKLAAMQKPVQEEIAVQVAREEWERRKQADRRAWEVKETFRRQNTSRTSDSTSPPRKPLIESVSKVEDARRSPHARAAEWRNSVSLRPSLPKSHTLGSTNTQARASPMKSPPAHHRNSMYGGVGYPFPSAGAAGYHTVVIPANMVGSYESNSPPLGSPTWPTSRTPSPSANRRLTEIDRRRISQGALGAGAVQSSRSSTTLLKLESGSVVEEIFAKAKLQNGQRTSVHW